MKLAALLTYRLMKGQPDRFDYLEIEGVEAFQQLKPVLLHPPVFALTKIVLPYTLDSDASDAQTGCCLMQEQDNGNKVPIGYST